MTRRLLLGGLKVTPVVELTDQRQLAEDTLQSRSFTSMVSLYRAAFPSLFVAIMRLTMLIPSLFTKTANCPVDCINQPHYTSYRRRGMFL